ncbi:MAG TPA: signal peptidase I [candidate division Zixibacteria bacterium]|jgi:signal peptidase I
MTSTTSQNPPRPKTPERHGFGRTVWEYTKSLGIALVLAIVIKTSIVEAYKIPSGSMEDTLLVGDFLLANKFVYGSRIPLLDIRLPALRDPKPGDVVIFKFPRDPSVNYIKRCIATGGQTVEVRNKRLYVDGDYVPLPPEGKYTSGEQIEPAGRSPRDNFGPYTVPENSFFMMGDNRDNSFDSRFWLAVPRDLIQGQAMVIHWSWSQDEDAPEWTWSNPASLAGALLYNSVHFIERVRWNRFGQIIR